MNETPKFDLGLPLKIYYHTADTQDITADFLWKNIKFAKLAINNAVFEKLPIKKYRVKYTKTHIKEMKLNIKRAIHQLRMALSLIDSMDDDNKEYNE